MDKYAALSKGRGLTQQGREEGIRRLMSINLLKRLESSVYSFRLTLDRIRNLIDNTIQTIQDYKSDTADYLYENVSSFIKKEFRLDTAEITGNVDGKTTIPKLHADLNTVLTCFSPISKGKNVLTALAAKMIVFSLLISGRMVYMRSFHRQKIVRPEWCLF